MLGEIKSGLWDALGVDVACLSSQVNFFGFKNENWKSWRLFDGTPVLVPEKFNTEPDSEGNILMYPQGDRDASPCARMPKGGFYFDALDRQEKPIDWGRLDPRGRADDRRYLFLAMKYRMTELQGAVALAQVRKARDMVSRRRVGDMLTKLLGEIEGINPPHVPPWSAHSYWLYPFTINREVLKVSPEGFVRVLSAEGVPASFGYIRKQLYLFRVLKDQVTYGSSRCPFDCPRYGRRIEYREGDCPNAEKFLGELITIPINEFYTNEDVNNILRMVSKVARYYREKA